VEALPALDKVASITRMDSLRKLAFQQCQGRVSWKDGALTVDQIQAESRGVLRATGQYRQEGKNIDGDFKLGVAPQVAKAIPGAAGGVFAEGTEPYLWTDVRLTGTTDKPEEDLSSRLFSAAIGSVLEAIPSGVKDKVEQGAKGVWDILDRALGR